MTLNDFEKDIEPKILQRGKDYFAGGFIDELWQKDTNHYCAVVEGSEPYDVEIWLDADRNITNHSCDCPYDWGEYCKHEVAVLLAIREKLNDGSSLPKERHGKKQGLRAFLEAHTKDELIDMILDISKEYGFREDIRYYFDDEEWEE